MMRGLVAGMVVVFGICMGAMAGAETLRMGILPVLDTLPLHVAVQEGLFAEQGLEVELVPFSSALERDTAMQSGQLDGYFGDMLNTMLLIQGGVPMRMVTVSYATAPGQRMFALLLAPGVSFEDAEDALEVGISKASIIEYLLQRMQAETETETEIGSIEAVEVKQIPIRLQMLLAGQLDGALLPEPLASLAQSKGATVVASDEALGMPLTVLCLHEDALASFAAFNAAYGEAVRRINANPEDYRALMTENCRIPEDLAESFPVYAFPESALPDSGDVEDVQQWMLDNGLLQEPLAYDDLVAR